MTFTGLFLHHSEVHSDADFFERFKADFFQREFNQKPSFSATISASMLNMFFCESSLNTILIEIRFILNWHIKEKDSLLNMFIF